jgi:hypothetical protein
LTTTTTTIQGEQSIKLYRNSYAGEIVYNRKSATTGNMKPEVGCTTGSRGEVPGERKLVTRDNYGNNNKDGTAAATTINMATATHLPPDPLVSGQSALRCQTNYSEINLAAPQPPSCLFLCETNRDSFVLFFDCTLSSRCICLPLIMRKFSDWYPSNLNKPTDAIQPLFQVPLV